MKATKQLGKLNSVITFLKTKVSDCDRRFNHVPEHPKKYTEELTPQEKTIAQEKFQIEDLIVGLEKAKTYIENWHI